MYEKLEECPVCAGIQFKNKLICTDQLVSKESFAIMECTACGLLFTNPRPDKSTITKYYESNDYLSHHQTSTLLGKVYRLAQSYTLWHKYRLLKKLATTKIQVLDYGCGSGTFLKYLDEKKVDAIGVEPNTTARDHAISTGCTVFSDLDQVRATGTKFQIITLWHVLEHLHDLKESLQQLKKLLHPGGYLIIAVPNTESWDAKHYRENWAAYDVPRHLYHFSKTTIKELLKSLKLVYVGKKPMYLDSFYISLLSEKYKNGKVNLPKSILFGCKSNIYGYKTGEFSSMIYIFQKK